MTAVARRGTCPSLAAPMATGDGLLVRLAPALRFFQPREMAAIAIAAGECGNGLIEISSRGNLQIRGLTAATIPQLQQQIDDAGIAVAAGLPIDLSPLAGLDLSERGDAKRLASDIRRRLVASDFAAALGPKVSVVIDGGGIFALSSLIADIRLVAAEAGWWLLIGGDEHNAQMLGLAPDDRTAMLAVETFLRQIAAIGTAARGRDLGTVAALDGLGIEPARTSLSPRPSRSPIGHFRLAGEMAAIGVAPAFGSMTATDLSKFAAAAEVAGVDQIRLAPGKAMLLVGRGDGMAVRARAAASDLNLICDPADPRHAIEICAGAPACASGHFDTRRFAARLACDCAPLLRSAGKISVSGCEKRCGRRPDTVLDVVGTAGGIQIVKRDEADHLDALADCAANIVNGGGANDRL